MNIIQKYLDSDEKILWKYEDQPDKGTILIEKIKVIIFSLFMVVGFHILFIHLDNLNLIDALWRYFYFLIFILLIVLIYYFFPDKIYFYIPTQIYVTDKKYILLHYVGAEKGGFLKLSFKYSDFIKLLIPKKVDKDIYQIKLVYELERWFFINYTEIKETSIYINKEGQEILIEILKKVNPKAVIEYQ